MGPPLGCAGPSIGTAGGRGATSTVRRPETPTAAHTTISHDFRMVCWTFKGEKPICNRLHLEPNSLFQINTEVFCLVLTWTELSGNAIRAEVPNVQAAD